MTITYKDRTFCVNKSCKNRCSRFLTEEIKKEAEEYGLPIAMCNCICTDVGEDNKDA